MSDQKITVLSDRDHCLLRPGMYIGSIKPEKQNFWVPTTDGKFEKKEIEYIPGLFKIFAEVLDNAVDEVAVRGFGDTINVEYDKETGFISVMDNGRGIPITVHEQTKIPTPQVVFAHLRSGSNFSDTERETVGMNGVGATLATIFSEKLIVQIRRDNKVYQQVFKDNLAKIEPPVISSNDKQRMTGTGVKFKPDYKIFSKPLPEILVYKRCLELATMYPKITINLKIVSDKKEKDCFECNERIEFKGTKFESFIQRFDTKYYIFEDTKAKLKFALCLNKNENFEHYSVVNGADTFRGGTHVECLRDIIAQDFKEKIWKEQKLEVSIADVAKHMHIVVFQTWNAPQFEGQTKEKFVNDKTDVKKFYEDLFSSRRLTSIVSEMSEIKTATIDTVTLKNERKELQDLKKNQKVLDKKRIAKLIECSSRDRNKCSIYITEGDSAISNLATVRDAKTMAGLPLRGKIMNVYESSAREVLENKEIQSIMASIGLKIGDPAVEMRLGKLEKNNLNYGKIIIATDQDMDGYSIRCLLINFIFKWWPEVVQAGLVYILETPLYEVINRKTSEINYFYNKKQYEEFISGKNTDKYEISYFKGLGSCGREAWDYMINKNPNLIQICSKDIKQSQEILKMAFSEDSEARKKWLAD